MGLIFLEALAAGLILIFIVWWTMFSGRDKGELRRDEAPKDEPKDGPEITPKKEMKKEPASHPEGTPKD